MSNSLDERLARATLIGLRASLPLPHLALGSGYLLLPSQSPMDRDEVVGSLVALPKPMRCVATAIDGALAVGAWTFPPPGNAGNWPDAAHRDVIARSHAEGRMLFLAEGEDPVVLNPAEFFAWQDQYEVAGLGLSWSWADENPIARVHNATTIVGLSCLALASRR